MIVLSWWIMQPGNIGHRIARHISRGFMHISWEMSSCWGRARYACPIAVGHFLPARRFAGSFEGEGRKEGRKSRDVGEVPEAAAEKIGSRYRRRRPPPSPSALLPPKRLHRRWEPSPVLFQHFAALFYLTPRPTLLCDWIIQIPFSVLPQQPALVANRAPTPPLSRPPRLSGDFHPMAISHCVFRLAAAVYTDTTC